MVELFSDEPKHRCRCGEIVRRETIPKCADWCPAAAQCFGDAADVRVLKRRLAKVKNDPRAAECVANIRRLLKAKERRDDQS
jgi:Fe-S-cluster-containing dehydrogenase component